MGIFDGRAQFIYHDVRKGDNLDLLIRGFHGIGNRLVDAIASVGTGLQAIALALSTPNDNSEQVQAQIDKFTQEIRGIRTDLSTAVNQSKEKDNG